MAAVTQITVQTQEGQKANPEESITKREQTQCYFWAVRHWGEKPVCFWLHPLRFLLPHFTSFYSSHITSVSWQVVPHIYHSPQANSSILSLTNLSRCKIHFHWEAKGYLNFFSLSFKIFTPTCLHHKEHFGQYSFFLIPFPFQGEFCSLC